MATKICLTVSQKKKRIWAPLLRKTHRTGNLWLHFNVIPIVVRRLNCWLICGGSFCSSNYSSSHSKRGKSFGRFFREGSRKTPNDKQKSAHVCRLVALVVQPTWGSLLSPSPFDRNIIARITAKYAGRFSISWKLWNGPMCVCVCVRVWFVSERSHWDTGKSKQWLAFRITHLGGLTSRGQCFLFITIVHSRIFLVYFIFHHYDYFHLFEIICYIFRYVSMNSDEKKQKKNKQNVVRHNSQ